MNELLFRMRAGVLPALLLLTTFFLVAGDARAVGLTIENMAQWTDVSGGNDHVYGLVRIEGLTWTNSSTLAADEIFMGVNGHLATFTSADELSFVLANVLPAANPGAPQEHVFAGGQQVGTFFDPTVGWQWQTGETWAYTNWNTAGSQPDGFGFSPEKFLAVATTTNRGTWNDVADNSPAIAFLIEFDTHDPLQLPEPDAALLLAAALAGIALLRP